MAEGLSGGCVPQWSNGPCNAGVRIVDIGPPRPAARSATPSWTAIMSHDQAGLSPARSPPDHLALSLPEGQERTGLQSRATDGAAF
jgi:hypothetical protein